jgi:hypothetical protein
MSSLGRLLDERFFAHRRRSTTVAGIASTVAAWAMFVYRYYVSDVVSWELFAVVVTFVVVKLSLMMWYYATE